MRNTDNLFPRKEDLGNGEIEIVVGDVLDKVTTREFVFLMSYYLAQAIQISLIIMPFDASHDTSKYVYTRVWPASTRGRRSSRSFTEKIKVMFCLTRKISPFFSTFFVSRGNKSSFSSEELLQMPMGGLLSSFAFHFIFIFSPVGAGTLSSGSFFFVC